MMSATALHSRRLMAKDLAVQPRGEIVRALNKSRVDLKLKSKSLVKTERELKVTRKRYNDFYDVAPVGFMTLTASGRIDEINLPAVNLLNHDRQNMLDAPFVRFIAKADHKKFLVYFARCRRSSKPAQPLSAQLQLARLDHEKPGFVELFTIPAARKKGGKVLYNSVIKDITPFKLMQEVHGWLAAIVESSDDAIIGIDLKGNIISCNKGVSRLYRYAPEELIGKPINILRPPELQDKRKELLRRVWRGETIEHFETAHLRKDGTPIEVSLTISPIKDGEGKIIGASKIARDITQRKRSEKELAETLDREKAANRAKDDFLAALSHELRTPLNPVLLLASDSAHDLELSPRIRTNFETIRKNIELEAKLIDDLLDLTRITRGKLVLNLSELDVHEILNDAISTVRGEIEEKQILLKLDLHADTHKIFGDAVRLQQIFWNILKNAVKFTYEHGQIVVESRNLPGDKILINITDTGIGMDPDELGHVFGAFSQGTHRFGGLGLGLAISRALVELHSGAICATSPGKGKGSMLSIELPLSKWPESETTIWRLPVQSATAVAAARKPTERLHILLVEDHEPTRLALTQLLLHRRYQVTSAASFAEAMSLIEKNGGFQLLISDLGLPDGSGYDLMAEFKKKPGAKGIALTGYGTEDDVARSQASGFTTHLTKPVRIESLEHALTLTLESAADDVFVKNGMPR